ncbi:F-box/FBD/LRR-repeat protein [Quillaja saponaria]|uniref:F-box/FBD/LRR-repeat protein n=1 Tax=Quillaja saponaria TaxID=32244 RepID=A0AAD7L9L7_QUISA|nr:F-box/FBD/LRR-repeat protein [Quillaja saponaria]
MCLPIRDAVKTSILSSKWRHRWLTIPKLVFDDCFCTKGLEENPSSNERAFQTIYEILLDHNMPIHKLGSSFPGLKICPEINHVISFVSKNNMQEFSHHIREGQSHNLPSSLFSCPQLRCLELSYCVFNLPPAFKGFRSLIGTKRTPNLASVTMEVYDTGLDSVKQNDMTGVLACMPMIEHLSLNSILTVVIADQVPERLLATLDCLKSLVFFDTCFKSIEELTRVFCLIRSASNLQKIQIWVHDDKAAYVDPVLEYLTAEDFSDISLNYVQEVEMFKVEGIKPELEFIKLILEKSPLLQMVHIKPTKAVLLLDEKNFLIELIQFPRASPRTKIIYLAPV